MAKNIPRYVDERTGERFDITLQCPKCGWAIIYDRVTKNWNKCRLCKAPLERERVNY